MIFIGICGGSCSGKTTLSNRLSEKLDATIISQDNYYLPHKNMSCDEKRKINYDCPESLDNALLIKHIKDLKEGFSIECPVYDFSEHDRSNKTVLLKPRDVIIAEGILLFENKFLRELFELKIFVDSDSNERLSRRIQRDTTERGRSVEDIYRQYKETVEPMHNIYIEPFKKYADIIVKDEADYDRIYHEIEKRT